jgi:DNA invertase Pin-like site-specific DNA recombinase
MIAEHEAERIRRAHSDFERARGRIWVERVRVGLEHRRAMRKIDEEVARVRLERDRLIRKAVAAGASYREVARALGLSHSRIQQIVNSPSKQVRRR